MLKGFKKALAVTLAAAMVTSTFVCSFAATETNASSSNTSTQPAAPAASSVSETPAQEVPTTSVAGGVKSATEGMYTAKSVEGSAVTTPATEIKAGFGLAGNDKPYTKVSDLDPKKSTKSAEVLRTFAATQGAVVGPMLNIEFGKMSGGKYSLLPKSGSIAMRLALAKNFFVPGATYAVLRVSPGGQYEIIPAAVDAKGNLGFFTNGGQGAYAVIRY